MELIEKNIVSRVLLIDDDPSCNFILSEFINLVDSDVDKLMAYSVEESFEILSSTEPFPEIIFVDLNMPIKSGFDFLKEYEETYYQKYPSTKVIVLTSSLRPSDKEQTLNHKCVSAFESKSEIHAFINEALVKV